MKDLNNILGLNDQIRKIIKELYCTEFTGNIKVECLDGLYILKLYIHHPFYAPLVLSFLCCSIDEFLKCLYDHLKENQLNMSTHFKLNYIPDERY